MAREITISDLKSKVDEGWKKVALAEHYGLPVAQMTRLLQEAGLKIRKFHAPLYVLVNDTVETITNNTEEVVETQGVVAEEDVNDIPAVVSEEVEAPVMEEQAETNQTTW